MNSDRTKATKEAVSKKMEETDKKAHEKLNQLKESKLGKLIPTEYSKISTSQVALASMVIMALVDLCIFGFGIALNSSNADKTFATSFKGIALGIIFIVGIVHDALVYFLKKGSMLLSFLGIRALTMLIQIVAMALLDAHAATLPFKILLIVGYGIVNIIYTYGFSVFISSLKSSSSSNPSEHQAV
ncbi:hypothetical protein NEOKW01_1622 [Nematocida sp. AWRm80]|nr:hypothetical protein NEOKW01_1622 [Nematocida sp. AWRm80]